MEIGFKCMKRKTLTIALLLIVCGLVFHWGWETGQAPQGNIKESVQKMEAREQSSLPALAPILVEDAAQKPEVEISEKPFIREVISSEWIDPAEKLAGRLRVRIVEANFKYPHLRLEESVVVDAQTGEETVTLLRTSVADHVMVGLAPEADLAPARSALEESGYRIRAVEPGSFILAEIENFEAADSQQNAIQEITELDEFVSFAEPDYIVYPCVLPNDPDFVSGKMWGLHNPGQEAGSIADADIDAPEAWELRTSATDVVVAVTDTGIQYHHEDLRDNMWKHPTTGVHGFDSYGEDSDPMDPSGHGTHCAGTIGASGNNGSGTTGVAWKVQLMALRFLGPDGGSTSDGIRVINYARQNGADIISASWGGGGYSQSLFNAIDACRTAGIPFVAAAGNDGVNNDSIPHYPSSYNLSNIVSVAATDHADRLSYFSCYGKYSVDIAAPGSSIWSSYIGGNQAYRYLNGTSMATPHVSGALALAKAHFPGESSASLINRLHSSADRVRGLFGKTSSGGRLNIDRLLRSLTPRASNDNFADALRFEDDYGFWTGSNEGATREADEDNFSIPGTGTKSIWFAFNSGHGGLVSLESHADNPDFQMLLFEGSSKTALKKIASSERNNLSEFRTIRFFVKPDTEYRVLLDTKLAPPQDFTLAFSLSPPNDFFSDATILPAGGFTVKGSNRGATQELFEKQPPHFGKGRGSTVWWRWTAAVDEDFTINTSGSDFDTVLSVYTGATAGNLSQVAWNDDRSSLDHTSQVSFAAKAGTTYQIVVDAYRWDASGNIVLNGFESGQLVIVRHPQSQQKQLGKRAVFDVSAFSGGEISYQWFLNDKALPGRTSNSIVIDPVRPSDLGDYRVQVYNSENSVLSEPAILSELLVVPVVTWQSGNAAAAPGGKAAFSVVFSGSLPMTFAWEKDGYPFRGNFFISQHPIRHARGFRELPTHRHKCGRKSGGGHATQRCGIAMGGLGMETRGDRESAN